MVVNGTPITRTFRVTNTGGGGTLNLSGLTVMALDGVNGTSAFKIAEPLSASLTQGQSDEFTVQLNAGTTAASYTRLVNFYTNDSDEARFTFYVKGTLTATQAAPVVTGVGSGPIFATGAVQRLNIVGTGFSPTATVVLRNLTAGVDVPVVMGTRTGTTGIAVDANLGTAAGNWRVTVKNGATASNDFNFDVVLNVPEIAVTLTSGGANIPALVGLPPPTPANWIDFGSVPANGTPITKSFTVTNTGYGILNLSGLRVLATDGNNGTGTFKILGGLSTGLTHGQSSTFTVQLNTSGLTIASYVRLNSFDTNDSDEAKFQFYIRGTITA